MITEEALNEAIAECEGQRNPNANTCSKLASFYVIKEHLFGDKKSMPVYSYATAPMISTGRAEEKDLILYQSDSEFSELTYGKKQENVMAIIDELMSALSVLNPRLYRSVIRKLEEST